MIHWIRVYYRRTMIHLDTTCIPNQNLLPYLAVVHFRGAAAQWKSTQAHDVSWWLTVPSASNVFNNIRTTCKQCLLQVDIGSLLFL